MSNSYACGFSLYPATRGGIQLWNPLTSGVDVLVDEFDCNNWQAGTYWTIRAQTSEQTATAKVSCNVDFSGAASVAKCSAYSASPVPGNVHAEHYRITGRPLFRQVTDYDHPLIKLVPGRGVVIFSHSNGKLSLNIGWREV